MDRAYDGGFCGALMGVPVEAETETYLRAAQISGERMALLIRGQLGDGRIDALLRKTADAQAMRVLDHRRIMLRWEMDGGLPRERPAALEPCATCKWITICAVVGTTCKAFRRYAASGIVSISTPPGPPDATWQESWHDREDLLED